MDEAQVDVELQGGPLNGRTVRVYVHELLRTSRPLHTAYDEDHADLVHMYGWHSPEPPPTLHGLVLRYGGSYWPEEYSERPEDEQG